MLVVCFSFFGGELPKSEAFKELSIGGASGGHSKDPAKRAPPVGNSQVGGEFCIWVLD